MIWGTTIRCWVPAGDGHQWVNVAGRSSKCSQGIHVMFILPMNLKYMGYKTAYLYIIYTYIYRYNLASSSYIARIDFSNGQGASERRGETSILVILEIEWPPCPCIQIQKIIFRMFRIYRMVKLVKLLSLPTRMCIKTAISSTDWVWARFSPRSSYFDELPNLVDV